MVWASILQGRRIFFQARNRRVLSNSLFQVFGGMFFAVAASWAMVPNNRHFSFDQNVINTLMGSLAAILVGYILLKKIASFPGARVQGYIIPIFATSFMVVFSLFFFLRLEYGRVQFISSFFFTVAWFGILLALTNRLARPTLAIIPVGEVASLAELPGVRWKTLMQPASPLGDVNGVVADLSADHPAHWQRFLTDAVLSGTPVFNVKQVREVLTGRVEIMHLSENTLGSLNPNDGYLKLKHALDFISASIVAIIGLPVLLLVGALIRLDSPGPALFRQQRVGRGGAQFTMFKFRTMVDGATRGDARESARTLPDDARITRLGRMLRRTRLDELPQVINILKGDMSLIGPRPEAVPLAQHYEEVLPFYRYRHIIRPGITGWAQVNQGHVIEVDAVLEKLHYDFYYIKNFSAWLDILIVLKTTRIILSGFGAR